MDEKLPICRVSMDSLDRKLLSHCPDHPNEPTPQPRAWMSDLWIKAIMSNHNRFDPVIKPWWPQIDRSREKVERGGELLHSQMNQTWKNVDRRKWKVNLLKSSVYPSCKEFSSRTAPDSWPVSNTRPRRRTYVSRRNTCLFFRVTR